MLNISFNPRFIIQDNLVVYFDMISGGDKLVIFGDYKNEQIMRNFLTIAPIIILALFCLSLLGHKMIGIETLHPIQMIYLVHSLDSNFSLPFALFKYLTYVTLNFGYLTNQNKNIYLSSRNQQYSQLNK